MIGRRSFLAAAALTAGGARAATAKSFRIGYQKNGASVVAKLHQSIEDRLRPLGVSVTWTEFSFGPPLLEALRLENIDFGYTGDAPPIFAQAAGADLVYVAALPKGSSAAAILLPAGSTLKTVAGLKGKRVAFARASSAHNLLVAALEQAGLSFRDIQPVALAPADAAAAFARGSVDAWSIWDPYYAIAEGQPGTQVLIKAAEVSPQNGFHLSNRAFAAANGPILEAAIAALRDETAWVANHREDMAAILTEGTKVPIEATRRAVNRTEFTLTPMTPDIIAQQQRIADRFQGLGLIPAPIRIADAVWHSSTT